MFEAFRLGAARAAGGVCLGWRNTPLLPFQVVMPFLFSFYYSIVFYYTLQWLTYDETLLRAQNFGRGLVTLGLAPGPNTKAQ